MRSFDVRRGRRQGPRPRRGSGGDGAGPSGTQAPPNSSSDAGSAAPAGVDTRWSGGAASAR
jgi:hypothetical protein